MVAKSEKSLKIKKEQKRVLFMKLKPTRPKVTFEGARKDRKSYQAKSS